MESPEAGPNGHVQTPWYSQPLLKVQSETKQNLIYLYYGRFYFVTGIFLSSTSDNSFINVDENLAKMEWRRSLEALFASMSTAPNYDSKVWFHFKNKMYTVSKTIKWRKQNEATAFALTSYTINKCPVGAVHLEGQYEAEWHDGGQ